MTGRDTSLATKIHQMQNRNFGNSWSESERRKRGIPDVVAASIQLKYPAPTNQTRTPSEMLRNNTDGIGEFGFAVVRPKHLNPFRDFDFCGIKAQGCHSQ